MNGSRLSPEPLLLEIWEWVQIEAGCKGYQAKMGGGGQGRGWGLELAAETLQIYSQNR